MIEGIFLPCKCGAVRILQKKLRCPVCESIEVVDPAPRIKETERYVKELKLQLSEALKRVSPELVVEMLIIEREKAAQRALVTKAFDGYAVRRWLSISFLLSLYPWEGTGLSGRSFVEYLISSAEEIIECENELFRLKKGIEKIVRIEGSEEKVATEFDVLYNIPEEVLKRYKQQLAQVNEEFLEGFDLIFIREAMVQPGLPLIIGDAVFRELKKLYPYRILPMLRPIDVHDFIEMCLKMAGFLAFQLGRNFADKYGILKTDIQFLEEVKSLLFGKEKEKVSWFFNYLENTGDHSQINLGKTVIIRTTNDLVFLPYFSLFLLAHLCLRWEKRPEKGEYYRYIGETVEDIIFSFISGYSLNTTHPLNGKPLVRVPHPEKNSEEIADVMGYDDRYLVVIESKFREILTIKDLENELSKFREKLNYIQNNLTKFDFPENLEVKPFFYVPYPPYNEWNDIKLVPSLVLLGIELSHFVKPRPTKLAPRSKELQRMLKNIKDATPYPVDLSVIDKSISPNTYRVQDGVVKSYDKEEITVFIDNPIGLPTILIADISNSIYEELKSAGVDKGDVIKMILLNLNNAWTQIQLAEFKVMKVCELQRKVLDDYGLLSILQQNSEEHAIEKLIIQTWGEKVGKEILAVLRKWNINFPLFLQNQIDKGQNVLIGVGKLLGLADMHENLIQCKCGEVMGLSSDLLKVMKKMYPDGVQCPKCDPEQLKRLREMGYPLVKIDHSVMLENILRSLKEKS